MRPAPEDMAGVATGPAPHRAPPGGRARPWLIVTGDLTPLGGMDRANHALALHLARSGVEVRLATHRAWDDLLAEPTVRLHRVPRPWGKHLLGGPLLARAGRRLARLVAAEGGRVVVNGSNCDWPDINWLHYVHAAWAPRHGGPALRRAKAAVMARRHRAAERRVVGRARLVIANSEQTRRQAIELLGARPEAVHTVYYGSDPARFRPPTEAERAEARARLGWADGRPAVAFVGALGDLRKGFDTLFEAWRRLRRGGSWDARLVVAGSGSSLPGWQARAAEAGLGDSIRFLGFCRDVPGVLAACDALASPTRYEAYGLNVREALCCDLPALVTASAGVAEHYPEALDALRLRDPDDPAELADRLRAWRDDPAGWRAAVAPLGEALRARTWDHCAAEIAGLAESLG